MSNVNRRLEHLKVQVQVKRPRRFKAGAELSSAVNLTVDVEDCEESEDFKLQLTIWHEPSSRLPVDKD